MFYSQLVAPRHSEVVEGAVSQPGEGEVLLEIKACGVCASELHTWSKGPPDGALRLGHEPSGVVRAVGQRVTDFRPGDAVTGVFVGAFSQIVITRQENLVHVPEGVHLESALGEPLACLVNAARRTPIELADRVVVVGLGFMGLGMLQLVKLRGPGMVVAVDVREDARKRALDLGADEAYHPENVPDKYLLTRLEEWSGPNGMDVVVESSGTQPGLTLAGQMVRAHGTLSILGFHQGGGRQVEMEMWNWKAIDVVNAHVRRHADLFQSMKIGLRLIERGLVDFDPLVTHRYTLDQVDQAFADLRDKPRAFVKAVVIP